MWLGNAGGMKGRWRIGVSVEQIGKYLCVKNRGPLARFSGRDGRAPVSDLAGKLTDAQGSSLERGRRLSSRSPVWPADRFRYGWTELRLALKRANGPRSIKNNSRRLRRSRRSLALRTR